MSFSSSPVAEDFAMVTSRRQMRRMSISVKGPAVIHKIPAYNGDSDEISDGEQDESAIDDALSDPDTEITEPDEQWVHSIKAIHVGLAAVKAPEGDIYIGYSINDGIYSIDYAVRKLKVDYGSVEDSIAHHVTDSLMIFSCRHLVKIISAGVSSSIVDLCPRLPSILWAELDVIPFVIPLSGSVEETQVDELADSMVRKSLMWIGPQELPRLSIVSRNLVDVDAGCIHIADALDYERSVGAPTWMAFRKLAHELSDRNVKIAFFSATPQGGGVALMRHSLIRLFRLVHVHATWHVPKPNPAVFRITKNNHNILQGVADPSQRISQADKERFDEWIQNNAERYWFRKGGPLAAGGADVVFIDDPQMVGLIPMIKRIRPNVPVVYRSHIEIRSDLTNTKGTPQAEVWDYLWERIHQCDLFIAHPVKGFVPQEVDMQKVGMMPATTDWLDGLNKSMAKWDVQYYFRKFWHECEEDRMTKLAFPDRGYLCQVARFDPSKGIPDVLEAYEKLREKLKAENVSTEDTPQLLICGHGAVDDPDGTAIYDKTLKSIDNGKLKQYKDDIVIMRLGPSDQMLNVLLSNCRVALQLSHREGFEVKISEALHKNIPVVAYRAGGIPLQIHHNQNGFLVNVGDTDGVAKCLYDLWMNVDGVYDRLQEHAGCKVSDEVSTVGNAACWSYLAATLSRGEKVEPNGEWVYDLMRTAVGVPIEAEEEVLPRRAIELQ